MKGRVKRGRQGREGQDGVKKGWVGDGREWQVRSGKKVKAGQGFWIKNLPRRFLPQQLSCSPLLLHLRLSPPFSFTTYFHSSIPSLPPIYLICNSSLFLFFTLFQFLLHSLSPISRYTSSSHFNHPAIHFCLLLSFSTLHFHSPSFIFSLHISITMSKVTANNNSQILYDSLKTTTWINKNYIITGKHATHSNSYLQKIMFMYFGREVFLRWHKYVDRVAFTLQENAEVITPFPMRFSLGNYLGFDYL